MTACLIGVCFIFSQWNNLKGFKKKDDLNHIDKYLNGMMWPFFKDASKKRLECSGEKKNKIRWNWLKLKIKWLK